MCTQCKQEMPATLDYFYIRKENKQGLNTWCKRCCKIRDKDYPKNKRWSSLDERREWYRSLSPKKKKEMSANTRKGKLRRMRVFIKLVKQYCGEWKCVECGEDNPLTLHFDHINPKEKLFEIGQRMYKVHSNPKQLVEELCKCRILCANCHSIHSHQQMNSARYEIYTQEGVF